MARTRGMLRRALERRRPKYKAGDDCKRHRLKDDNPKDELVRSYRRRT